MIDKSEKYLKSIDNTLGDILKELKRQRQTDEVYAITLDTEAVSEVIVECFKNIERTN
ncbi:hypothetical protein C7437_1011031 [Psychrobacillus insolitus]|uniref:Uncharacterized protein n=1 Tax=Psychrobacillus insolitus TaxID=1461 RepID=A0A2W7NBS6_9BACI|nr:hypothetical protein [Psychrobacillus insolitus]PZX07909.1 hypothetical protein C7437_1011031 [Psychrobacillus insolitus]